MTTKDFSTTQFQIYNNSAATYTVNVPHVNTNNIKSALVICVDGAWLISVGGPTQVWAIKLGGASARTMTITIAEHTTTNVKVTLTFNDTIYGGIQVIAPYFN